MRVAISALSFSLTLLAAALCLPGQTVNSPVIYPRGVVDATRLDPAPATVARGGIVQITGFNLGPDTAVKATGTPLPTTLGDKPVQVLINGVAVPLLSVAAGKVLAQVPVDAALGLASVAVKVGDATSNSGTFTIAAVQAGIVTKEGKGFGLAAGTFSKSPVTVSGTGFGATNPRAGTVTAFVGGIPTKVTTAESKTQPGIFDTVVDVPGQARPGDLLYVLVNARAANPVVLQGLPAAELQFLKLPDGAPDLAQIATPDLSGMFVLGAAVKDAKGCYAAFAFDFTNKKAAASNACLLAPANAATPFVNAPGTEFTGAMVGPAVTTGAIPAGAGIAKQALVFNPGKADKTIDLTGAASVLAGAAGGVFTATIPAATAGGTVMIDTITASTGAVKSAAAPVAAAAAAVVSVDGLTKLLTSRIMLPGGIFAVVVADDAVKPTKVEFAILKTNGDKVSAVALPGGFVPLLAPQAPAAAGVTPPAVGATGLAFYLAAKKTVYVAAKMPDDSLHAFAAFPLDGSDATVVPLPSGWFIAACSNALRTYNFVIGKQLGLFASNSGVNTYKAACPASGYLEMDVATAAITAVPLPVNSDMVTGAATGTFNDFLYATNFSPTARTASSVYVLDGTGAVAFRLEPPAGVNAFQAPTTISVADGLIASAQKRAAGDQGLVFFDLANQTSVQLPLPDNFATVTLAGFFPATRKVVVRGISADRKTSNLVVYDLAVYDRTAAMPVGVVVPNPDGVASLAGKPGAAASPRLLAINVNANTVSAVAFDADGKQVGVVTVRVP